MKKLIIVTFVVAIAFTTNAFSQAKTTTATTNSNYSGIYLRTKFMLPTIEYAQNGNVTINEKEIEKTTVTWVKNVASPALAIAAGYDLGVKTKVNLNMEFEYATRAFSSTFLVKAYYNFKNKSKFTPYLGLGLGALRLTLEDTYVQVPYKVGNNKTNGIRPMYLFALDIGAGLEWELFDRFSLTFGYDFVPAFGRYKLTTGSSATTNEVSAPLLGLTNDIAIGGKFKF